MFTTRLISGIVLVILAAFLLVKGGTLLFLVSLAISLIGLFELYRVMKIEKELPGLVGYGAVLAYYAIVWTGMDPSCDLPCHRSADAFNDHLCVYVP